MKTKVNLYWDKWNFGVEEREGKYPTSPSKFIEYTNNPTDIGIFVDYDGSLDNIETIVKNSSHKYKVMVQVEPSSFNRALHQWILKNEHLFDLIFVHYPAWVGSGKYPEKYRYYVGGSRTFIKPEDRQIYPKTKDVTAIFSQKNFGLVGHQLRHNIRNTLNNSNLIDFNNPINKVEGLKDYRYEVVIENEFPYFLSEKPIDSILSGCLPIIWGHKDTKPFEELDTDGFIFFETEAELHNILQSNMLTKEYYNSKLPSLQHNFNVVQNYLSFGDIIWKAGLKQLISQ
jgi:hypothetical protein|tara:strand:+ start:1030 stop:1887 length:858 start_codon:yes stop_codon:yes gene_type:complete